MSIRWHKIDVVFHLRGGQNVKYPASAFKTEKRGDELMGYTLLETSFASTPQVFYGRLDSIDMITLRCRGWWRWAW